MPKRPKLSEFNSNGTAHSNVPRTQSGHLYKIMANQTLKFFFTIKQAMPKRPKLSEFHSNGTWSFHG